MAKVLIIADQEGKGYAITRGLELAGKLGLDADVVAFAYAPLKRLRVDAANQPAVKKRLLEEQEAAAQTHIDRARAEGQKVALKLVWEKNIDKWVGKACAGGRYLAVVKTGSKTGTLVHTSTDWQLLRESPVPVLIVAEKRWHRTRPLLVSLDLGTSLQIKKRLNDKLLGTAKQLADALGVELEIIAAIEVPTLLADLDLIDPAAYAREAKALMAPHIEKLAKTHGLPVSAFHVKRGPVDKVITSRAAKVRAQIVVMGTAAHKGVKARLLGNTAEQVLRHLKTDVLAIKP